MTIDKKTRAEILRLHHAEKWKIGTIASQLGVHHITVRRVLADDEVPRHMRRQRRSKLDPFMPFIRQTLAKYPMLPASRLYEMVRKRGYQGSPSHFRNMIALVRPKPAAEAYLRLKTLPGEQAQVDWAHFGKVKIGRAERPLMGFVMVLSFSRRIFLRFYLNAQMSNFLRGHIDAFEAWQGVPRELWYDNLKSVVLERPRRRNPLQSTVPRLRRPLSFPGTARRGRPREREGARRAGHTLCTRQLLRRPLMARYRRSQRPGPGLVRRHRRRPSLARRPLHQRSRGLREGARLSHRAAR